MNAAALKETKNLEKFSKTVKQFDFKKITFYGGNVEQEVIFNWEFSLSPSLVT